MEENHFGNQAPPDLLYSTDNPVAGFYGRNKGKGIKGGGDFPIQSEFLDPPLTRYDTIRYDSVYLTCSKKLTDSQLRLPHGIN